MQDPSPGSEGEERLQIGQVAEAYELHPQTLRLYERKGLIRPQRSRGNTRLYARRDLDRLELILRWTRDDGINFAGVKAMLGLTERIDVLQRRLEAKIRSGAAEGDLPRPEAGEQRIASAS